MSSTFNLLTAGGARFDKSRFKADIELFSGKSSKAKGKYRADPTLPSSLNIFSDAQSHRPSSSRHPGTLSDSDGEMDEEALIAPPKQKITITGPETLPSSLSTSLESLSSHPSSPLPPSAAGSLISALRGAKIQSLWGVQTAVGGALLESKDVLCMAPTGSGKTLAYVLPTLVKLVDPARTIRKATSEKKSGRATEEGKGIRAVILVPTHDLAIQIHEVCRAVMVGRAWRCMVLSKATQRAVCESAPGEEYSANGTDSDDDNDMEEKEEEGEEDEVGQKGGLGLDVLIATPERLHHLVESKQVSLNDTRHLILDESDRLFSPDFLPQVKPIVAACTYPAVQKCLLSATMPPMAEKLARTWMRKGGVRIVVGVKDSAVTTVAQSLLYTASEQGKLLALRNLIAEGGLPYPSLIFVQSIERAEELHKTLVMEGLRVGMVHGQRSKVKRDEAVSKFREGSIWVLVVTEVLARGMDFRGVKVVINYDFPQTLQSYIHRIGRTGRAGRPGKSVTFVNTEDSPYLRTIARVLEQSGCEVPAYMLDLPKVSKDVRKRLAKAPVKRSKVGGGGRDVAKEDGRRRRDMIKASRRKKGDGRESGEQGGGASGEEED